MVAVAVRAGVDRHTASGVTPVPRLSLRPARVTVSPVTHGQDGVIETNGLPKNYDPAAGADSAVSATPDPSRLGVRPLGRIGMSR